MKTHKNLFSKIISFENLLGAAHKASAGKQKHPNVAEFFFHLEDNLIQIRNELTNQTYCPGDYNTFYIYDPKMRLISAAPFYDRVVHHALCNIIEPIFNKSFIFDSYANRKEKGTHIAIKRAQGFLKQNQYILKCDFKKYFPSIDHEILKQEIRWKIADPETLWLIDIIIDNSNEQEPVYETFPGDTLLTPLERRKGLPLGNLTSQFFANVYLNRFDHFVKEILKVKHYARYVDDFLMGANSKDFLKDCLHEAQKYVDHYRLTLHPKKCHILRSDKGVPFLGQIIFPDYRLLRDRNVRRFTQRLKKMEKYLENGDMTRKEFQDSIGGWHGHACQANTFRLRLDLEKKFSKMKVKLFY